MADKDRKIYKGKLVSYTIPEEAIKAAAFVGEHTNLPQVINLMKRFRDELAVKQLMPAIADIIIRGGIEVLELSEKKDKPRNDVDPEEFAEKRALVLKELQACRKSFLGGELEKEVPTPRGQFYSITPDEETKTAIKTLRELVVDKRGEGHPKSVMTMRYVDALYSVNGLRAFEADTGRINSMTRLVEMTITFLNGLPEKPEFFLSFHKHDTSPTDQDMDNLDSAVRVICKAISKNFAKEIPLVDLGETMGKGGP